MRKLIGAYNDHVTQYGDCSSLVRSLKNADQPTAVREIGTIAIQKKKVIVELNPDTSIFISVCGHTSPTVLEHCRDFNTHVRHRFARHMFASPCGVSVA